MTNALLTAAGGLRKRPPVVSHTWQSEYITCMLLLLWTNGIFFQLRASEGGKYRATLLQCFQGQENLVNDYIDIILQPAGQDVTEFDPL